jgi:hypothetical protein
MWPLRIKDEAEVSLTYGDARQMLSELLVGRSPDEYDSRAILEALSVIGRPATLARILYAVSADSAIVSDCASESFRHPLGFDKLLLIRCAPHFSLRMHVWWPGIVLGAEHIHSHRFNLLSFMVCGGYAMEIFEESSAEAEASGGGVVMTEYREAAGPDGGWDLCPVGNAYLKPVGTISVRQGVGYGLHAEALHRIVVTPATMCTTIFLETARLNATTRIFARSSESRPIRNAKEILSAESYREKLEAVGCELLSTPDSYAAEA